MLINNNRELVYVVEIDDIEQIVGSDNCEAAIVGGWKVLVRKGLFKKGDKVIYFEVDSRVPQTDAFEFLSKKNYKILTQRYTFGGKGLFFSQGLIMSFEDLNLDKDKYSVGQPLTKELGVTYCDDEDNERKATQQDLIINKYKNVLNKQPFKYLMRFNLTRKILLSIFNLNKDVKKSSFPKKFEYINKTDEERIENLPQYIGYKNPLVVTEKLDGTSCTYILEKTGFNRYEFYVASRNRRLSESNSQRSEGIYFELANKYDIKNKLKQYLIDNKLKYVCIQGEGVGNVQGNPLKLSENDLYVFNFIRSDVGRLSTLEGKEEANKLGFKFVPIIDTNYYMPNSMEEFKLYADGYSAVNPSVLREGFVLRDLQNSLISFKNVSREYLLKKQNNVR